VANYIKVSTQGIYNDRQSIQNELDGIKKAVDDLGQEMQALGQTWEGLAWKVFQAQVATDMENMQSVCDKLAVYITHMEYAETEYENCNKQIESLIRSIYI